MREASMKGDRWDGRAVAWPAVFAVAWVCATAAPAAAQGAGAWVDPPTNLIAPAVGTAAGTPKAEPPKAESAKETATATSAAAAPAAPVRAEVTETVADKTAVAKPARPER